MSAQKNMARKILASLCQTARASDAENSAISWIQCGLVGAEKFMLPDGGLMLPEGTNIAEAMGHPPRIGLPFDSVVLEFETPGVTIAGGGPSSMRAILAIQDDDCIEVYTILSKDDSQGWAVPLMPLKVKRDNAFSNGEIIYTSTYPGEVAGYESHGVLLVLGLICALSCKNVVIGTIPRVCEASPMAALPWDNYRILTIIDSMRGPGDSIIRGISRTPREHLRRGHVRRYANGATAWVNATVVAAGSAGKVTKDYKLPPA